VNAARTVTQATVTRPTAAAPALPAAYATSARTRTYGESLALTTTAIAVALMPLLRPGGPGNLAPVDLVVGLAIACSLLWAGVAGRRCRFPYGLPMCLFMAGGALAAMNGPVPTAGIVAIAQDVWVLAWCWTLVTVTSSPRGLRIILATWSYSAVVWVCLLFVGLVAHATFLTGQTPSEGSRTALTLIDPNYSANYYFISGMVMWASGFPRRGWVRVLVTVALLAAILSTGSNSGIVSVLVGGSALSVLAVHRRHGPALAVAALSALLLAGAFAASHVSLAGLQERAHGSRHAFLRDGFGRQEASLTARQNLLGESISLFEDGGPLGEGPVSTKVRLHNELAPYVKEAHDDYFAALIERGVLGFLGLAALLSAVGYRAVGLVRARLPDGFAAVLVRPYALTAAVAGVMTASLVYELLHVRHVWALFALVAAVSLAGRR
jgi:O-antigen ligase